MNTKYITSQLDHVNEVNTNKKQKKKLTKKKRNVGKAPTHKKIKSLKKNIKCCN